MNDTLANLKQQIDSWAADAHQLGLLPEETVTDISHFNAQTPASLFEIDERPLVVGFFGGTGVGKSTLLNRLAGENIARTSVERPTSREVTMYLHSTVHVNNLPAEFPVEKIARAFHNNEKNRHILWVDMPDFDSAESSNRQLVNDWLPHIDVLLYVVSPERYKDDNGWRLLLQHGHRHAWVFVINHWDRGNDAQRTDFTAMLKEAGLSEPMLYCTDSSKQVAAVDSDEFDALQSMIQSLADAKTISQLEARGITVRIQEMQSLVKQASNLMGTTEGYDSLKSWWNEHWARESAQILGSLQWKFQILSSAYQSNEPGYLASLFGRLTRRTEVSTPSAAEATSGLAGTTKAVIDDDTILRIIDDLDELPNQAATRQLPITLVRERLEALKPSLAKQLNDSVRQSLQQALMSPGTRIQRFVHTLFRYLCTLLPLLTMSWAGYRIVSAFYAGGSTPAAYLSSNFAVNALLLIGLSWLLPFFLARKTRPSMRKAAERGLATGTRQALQELQSRVLEQLSSAAETSNQFAERQQALFAGDNRTQSVPMSAKLDRVLIDKH